MNERLTKWKEYETNKRLYRSNKEVSIGDLVWKLGHLEDIEDKLGADLTTLFDYNECPFGMLEIEQEKEDNTIFFDGDSFYGHYTKEEFLHLIKRLIKAYLETWSLMKEELL